MVAGRHDLIPPGYIERIGRIRGVQKNEGRLWGYYYDPVVKANYTFMVRPDRGCASQRARSSSARRWSATRGVLAGNGTVLPLLFRQAVFIHRRRRAAARSASWSAPIWC
jgi:hypothetical protein